MIDVPDELRGAWERIERPLREHLDGFLHPAPCRPAGSAVVVAAVVLPPMFEADLVAGAPQLRAAFPHLRRTLARVTRHRTGITVRVDCEGEHTAPFFGIVRATHHRVGFVEDHRLQLVEGSLHDRVTIDLAGIIRQLR